MVERNPNTVWWFSGNDPWQNLANAIVALAADDYRKALKCDDKEEQEEIQKFFHSEWYKTLTKLNPNVLLGMLHEEHKAKIATT